MKRVKHYLINLTEEEAELLERLAEEQERKTSELARILLIREAKREWAIISQLDNKPLTPIKAH